MADIIDINDERIQRAINNLPEAIREQAKAATSKEELKEIIDNYDGFIDLSEDELKWVAGGCSSFDQDTFDEAVQKSNEIVC